MRKTMRVYPALATALLMGCLLPPAVYGAAETELKDDSGKVIIRYVVEPPSKVAAAGTADPAKQVGLILCFPEHDRPTGDEILPVREALIRLGVRDEYVLVAGHPQERKFGPADHEPIAKLIAWAERTYPINPRRIYMYGKGEGGKISGEFAMFNPKVVTASITYSWGWWKMPPELTEAIDPLGSAPEFYMVLGLRDLSYHLTTVRDAYARVSAKGYHVIYREFPELGARTYHPPSNTDALAWATRLRNKNLPLSEGEAALLKKFGHRAAPVVNAQGYYTELALVGGAQAAPVVQKLLASENPTVRAAAAETCRYAIFNEETISVLATKLKDDSPEVRRSAIHALAANANWRSDTAQHALVDLAVTPGQAITPEDRVGAVDGIVEAARLQINGARQDALLFKALVTLLDDKDEELHTMAANTLAPIRDADFRGDRGRPEQKEPAGGWQHWVEETSDKAAGYRKDYDACAKPGAGADEAVALFCKGGSYLLGEDLLSKQPVSKNPSLALKNTLEAAEKGYAPAENAVAFMYADGKGTEQDYVKAAQWWVKAAEAGHLQAAFQASMVYRGSPGVASNTELSEKWAKYFDDNSRKPGQ
jgi:HEAT repeats/Sel1 repeat